MSLCTCHNLNSNECSLYIKQLDSEIMSMALLMFFLITIGFVLTCLLKSTIVDLYSVTCITISSCHIYYTRGGMWVMVEEMNCWVQASILYVLCCMQGYTKLSAHNQCYWKTSRDHTGLFSYCIFTQPRRWGWHMHRATRKAQTLWWPQRQSWPASIQSWWTAAGSGLTSSPETPTSPHLC